MKVTDEMVRAALSCRPFMGRVYDDMPVFDMFHGIPSDDRNEAMRAALEAAISHAAGQECTLGVGDGSGQLFVHGSYDAIKACQALLLRGERDDWPKTIVVSSGDMCFTADWDGEYFVTRSPIKLDDSATPPEVGGA